MGQFIKFLVIWISQNLAIPFWVVGHIHLSFHTFHDLIEILSSIGMNLTTDAVNGCGVDGFCGINDILVAYLVAGQGLKW